MCTTLVQGRDLHVPGDASTVQAAIDAANGGDRIIVGPGLWAGTVDLGGKSITVESAEGPERTVLDAGGQGPGLRLVSGEGPRTVVRGFRITGGIGDATIYDLKSRVGGAVVIVGGAPVLENCIISGNSSSYRGGGIYASRSSFTMRNCVVRGNASEKGGGLYMFGGTPVIEGGSISFNNARYGGAGIFIDRSKVDCSGVLFESNIAHFSGGAVAVIDARPFIHDCRFLNNQAGVSGGAIHLGWGASLREEGNVYVQQGDNVIGGFSGRLRAAKGACCFGDLCIEVLEVACVEAGGRWEGPGTECVSILAARCEAVRPGDLDRNDQVDIRDLGRLLHVWGDLNAPQQGGADGEGR
jgi:hypothetical protein